MAEMPTDPHAEQPEELHFLLEQPSGWTAFKQEFKEFFFPVKPPELVLESKPIPVKSIWSEPKPLSSRLGSVGVHLAVLGIMMLPFWRPVRKQIQKVLQVQELFVPTRMEPPAIKVRRLSGGGVPTVLPKPKLVQTPKPQAMPTPMTLTPVTMAMNLPAFGAVGELSGPPGAGGGKNGGGSGGNGAGSAGGTCVGADCADSGGMAMTAPVPVYQPDPEYTEEARKAKFQGTCIVLVTISADGKVTHAQVLQPLGLGLDQKAIQAVLTWRFTPAKDKFGKPIATQAQIEVNFHLY